MTMKFRDSFLRLEDPRDAAIFVVGGSYYVEFPVKWYVGLWRTLIFYRPKPHKVASVDLQAGVVRFEVT